MAVPVRPFVLLESCAWFRVPTVGRVRPARGVAIKPSHESREDRGESSRTFGNGLPSTTTRGLGQNTVQRTAARASQRSGYPSSPFATSLPRNRRSPEKRRSTHADADAATIPEQRAGAHTHSEKPRLPCPCRACRPKCAAPPGPSFECEQSRMQTQLSISNR